MIENNSTRLVYGNHRGTTLPAPSIVIIRLSQNKFEVEIPATEEQCELIEQAHGRWHQRMRDEEALKKMQKELNQKEERRKQKTDKYSNPVLFKDDAIKFLNIEVVP